MLRRLARWIVRSEIEALRARLHAAQFDRDMWRYWALAQESYRQEVHGEAPDHPGFRAWFHERIPPFRSTAH